MPKSIRSEIAAIRPLDALERAQIQETLSRIDSGLPLEWTNPHLARFMAKGATFMPR